MSAYSRKHFVSASAMFIISPNDLHLLCNLTAYSTQSEDLYKEDISHMTSGVSLILALYRENAVKKLLDLLGPEDSKKAKQLDPFLWRGMYGTSITHNAFYGKYSVRRKTSHG